MALPDLINACFEGLAGFFVLISAFKTLKNKSSKGVSYVTLIFFSTWGYWNLFYYPHLEQWYSFTGGIFVTITNTFWVILLIKYRNQ